MPPSTSRQHRSHPFGARVRRASIAATCLLFIVSLGGMAVGYGSMERSVSGLVRAPVRPVFSWPRLRGAAAEFDADGRPMTWLSEPFRNELVVLATTVLNDDVFDRDTLARCGQALLASGWFRGVSSIRREADGVVRIDGVWREPAAVVRHGERDHLVSGDGELLPVSYRHGASGLRVVLNPSFPPPASPGEPWRGGDVQNALKLLAQLQASPAYPQVAAIDARGTGTAAPRLEIVTDAGNRVVWGSAPDAFAPAEVPTEIKLGRLKFLLTSADFGRRIDAGKPLVDIASPRDILIDVSARAAAPPTGEPAAVEPASSRAPPAPVHERPGAGKTKPGKHSLAKRGM